ncbi:mitochondrial import receptor subunit Tom22-domain-containing protein [Amylostereum chailletii]|nr:mitochondrial import receptor subunit Tom22-domain-containing protein [Amylostereum chailletii]
MVKVEIVEDKDAASRGSPYASPASSRTSSSVSLDSLDSEAPADESFFDRLAALRDIVPPSTRHSIATKASNAASVVKRTTKIAGNLVWIVTTSALLVGLPLALSLEGEAQIVEQEKQMLAQGGSQMLPGGSSGSMYPPPGAGSMYPPPPQGQNAQQGLVPPGF